MPCWGFAVPATPSGALAVRSVVPTHGPFPPPLPPLPLGPVGGPPLARVARLLADASGVLPQRPQPDGQPQLVHPSGSSIGSGPSWPVSSQSYWVPNRCGRALEGADAVLQHRQPCRVDPARCQPREQRQAATHQGRVADGVLEHQPGRRRAVGADRGVPASRAGRRFPSGGRRCGGGPPPCAGGSRRTESRQRPARPAPAGLRRPSPAAPRGVPGRQTGRSSLAIACPGHGPSRSVANGRRPRRAVARPRVDRDFADYPAGRHGLRRRIRTCEPGRLEAQGPDPAAGTPIRIVRPCFSSRKPCCSRCLHRRPSAPRTTPPRRTSPCCGRHPWATSPQASQPICSPRSFVRRAWYAKPLGAGDSSPVPSIP